MQTPTLSLAIAGAAGRMGQALIRAAAAAPDLRLAGASERPGAGALGVDLALAAGLTAPLGVTVSDNANQAAATAEVWIDFTTPEATLVALADLRTTPVRAAIIGTTGLSADQQAVIAEAAQGLAIVQSGNFSLGVNLLAALVEQAASKLGPEWDIEILEAHHRRKVDAPSGTALLLADAAARGRAAQGRAAQGRAVQGGAGESQHLPPRHGQTGARPEGAIGFAVLRGGGIVGDHDVMFAAEREIIHLSHQALDRALFADGALAAARWAASQPPGLYSMRDVLKL